MFTRKLDFSGLRIFIRPTFVGPTSYEVMKWVTTKQTLASSDSESNPGDRTDPTYKVDFTLSHCGTYGLKLVKTLVNSYPDIFARYKYDLGLAKVDPVEIPTTDDIQVAG